MGTLSEQDKPIKQGISEFLRWNLTDYKIWIPQKWLYQHYMKRIRTKGKIIFDEVIFYEIANITMVSDPRKRIPLIVGIFKL